MESEQRQTLKRMKVENFPEWMRDTNLPDFRKPATYARCIKKTADSGLKTTGSKEIENDVGEPSQSHGQNSGPREAGRGSERKQKPRDAYATEISQIYLMTEKGSSSLNKMLRELFRQKENEPGRRVDMQEETTERWAMQLKEHHFH